MRISYHASMTSYFHAHSLVDPGIEITENVYINTQLNADDQILVHLGTRHVLGKIITTTIKIYLLSEYRPESDFCITHNGF